MNEILKTLSDEHLTNMGLELIEMMRAGTVSEADAVAKLLEIDEERGRRDEIAADEANDAWLDKANAWQDSGDYNERNFTRA